MIKCQHLIIKSITFFILKFQENKDNIKKHEYNRMKGQKLLNIIESNNRK